jgi:transforming growth factor-beta-induced protein
MIMKKLNVLSTITFLLVTLLFISCDNDDKVEEPKTIAEIAIATPAFSNLVAALNRAGLVETLNGDGAFTVFAPTNDAFSTFLTSNGFDTVNDVPVDVLRQVLLNHVVSGINLSTGLTTTYVNSLATYNGTDANLSMYINTTNGVKINGIADVITPDVIASNGVIHVVNAVIGLPTIVTFATADPTFETLATALTTLTPNTDFVSVLSTPVGTSPAPFTVFAPTEDAFSAITIPTDEGVLTNVLLHHVIAGANVASGNLTPNGATTAASLEGDNLTVNLPGTGSNIANLTDGSGNTDIGIIKVDVQASNGVIHVINKVAIPTLE